MRRLTLIYFAFPLVLFTAEIDTVLVYSQAMQKEAPVVIIMPDSYQSDTDLFPVVYLLHGHSGNHLDWISNMDVGAAADRYGFIIVCPDGGYDSWYLDSPTDNESQYETLVAVELVQWIDSNYRTIRSKKGRAITGLSMGGHGAIYLAIRHPDNYGAAGSMSGVFDLNQASSKYDILKKLGASNENPGILAKHSVVNLIDQLTENSLAILIECGVDDRFLAGNRKAHSIMLEKGVQHDYIERPGGHTWDYWVNVLEYHLLFFKKSL
ncbi:MAG: alpha/beta hydrolase family protein [Candidatus Marinimicrobia bacterium]|jgi:S-formylglutathione hydrolase FrmB|nr:alpha/beta hydrolase family protein [Candidatus Neomarinimicrobiota bacterium]|tara:strand:- start:2417 stop:3214 length:798 start_codon:yes stop_codon:yes gene_type:complete